jgi:hypothetical protein
MVVQFLPARITLIHLFMVCKKYVLTHTHTHNIIVPGSDPWDLLLWRIEKC